MKRCVAFFTLADDSCKLCSAGVYGGFNTFAAESCPARAPGAFSERGGDFEGLSEAERARVASWDDADLRAALALDLMGTFHETRWDAARINFIPDGKQYAAVLSNEAANAARKNATATTWTRMSIPGRRSSATGRTTNAPVAGGTVWWMSYVISFFDLSMSS